MRVVEAGAPGTRRAGEAAAREILDARRGLGPDDLLLVLVSGGGSALLSLPAEGVAMADLKRVTRDLLASGAPIQDMNTVRKHLSAIQGGRLRAVCRAPVLALIISDVTGDDPTHIASGPCAPDPSTYAEAIAILARFGVEPPAAIVRAPRAGARAHRRRRRSPATRASRASRTASSPPPTQASWPPPRSFRRAASRP